MAKGSKKRRILVGVLQAILLIAVMAIIFFKVPAVNKMAQRKDSPSTTQLPSSTNANATSSTGASKGATSSGTGATQVGSAAEAGAMPVPVDPGEYSISVYKVETDESSKTIAVTLEINNPSKVVLKFDPARQFKFTGIKTGSQNSPVAPSGKPTFVAGQIQPGQTLSNILYVKKFPSEDGELRFYPQVGEPEFTIVPLIAVPAAQQNQ